MGVTYKLKSEVIEEILQLKKEQPSLSCRKISDILSEKHQKNISKSSVNNVLKSAALSNHVGRPKGYHPPGQKEAFKIPETKKKQIQKSLEQAGLLKAEAAEAERAAPKEPEKFPVSDKVAPLNPDSDILRSLGVPSGKKVERSVSAEPDKTEKEQKAKRPEGAVLPSVRRKKQMPFSQNIDGLGAKIMEAILEESGVVDVLEQTSGMAGLLPGDVRKYFEKYFMEGSQGLSEKEQKALQKHVSDVFIWEYLRQKDFFTAQIHGVRICFNNQKEFLFDVQARDIRNQESVVPARLDSPLIPAIKAASRYLIANTVPLVLFYNEANSSRIPDIVDALLNHTVTKTSFFDGKGGTVLEIDNIPTFGRDFILFYDSKSHIESIFNVKMEHDTHKEAILNISEKRIFYAQKEFLVHQKAVKIIKSWDPGKESESGFLLTNMRQDAEEILNFFQDRPFLSEEICAEPRQEILETQPAETFSGQSCLEDVFADAKNTVLTFLRNNYFTGRELPRNDLNDCVRRVCKISGVFRETRDTIRFLLDVPDGWDYFAQTVNARQSLCLNRKKILVNINSSA